MKTIEELADEMIAKQLAKLISIKSERYNMIDVVISCILSLEHTIEVLNKMDNEIYDIEPYITEQAEILNELKSRI